MTVGQKASLSLLAAVLLFAVFAVAAFSGLFNVLEARFYNPVITRQYETSLEATAKAIDVYHGQNHGKFAPVLGIDAVKRSFLPNLSMQDTVARENEIGKLKAVTPGLAGIRLIDQNGKRIHYSTWTGDVLRRGASEVLYRDYGTEEEAPFADIALPDAGGWKVRLDEKKGLFLYSLPFVDGFGLFRGTAVFSVAPAGLMDSLLRSGLVQVGDSLTPAGANGIILRVPAAGSVLLAAKVADAWSQGLGSAPIAIGDPTAGASWVLISRGGSGGSHVGIILPAATFQIPGAMKVLLLLAFFLTAYLLIFLISNLRHDRGVIIAERIKRYHIGVIEGTWSEKAETDLGRWRRQLESRKSEYREGIKADLGKLGKSAETEANELIDKSWDEIMSVLDRREQEESRLGGATLKEIERLIKEALGRGSFQLPASALTLVPGAPQQLPPRPAVSTRVPSKAPRKAPSMAVPAASKGEVSAKVAAPPAKAPPAKAPPTKAPAPALASAAADDGLEDLQDAEELAELDDAEEVAELDEADEAEEVAELDEAEEVAELDEAEEIAELDDAEEVAELDEADEAEEIAELDDAEEVAELDEAEEVAELDEADEAEEVAELDEAEEAEELDSASEVEEVEEVEELNSPDDDEELGGVGEVDEPGSADLGEELDNADEIEDIEEIDEVEELEEIEEIAENEEIAGMAVARKPDSAAPSPLLVPAPLAAPSHAAPPAGVAQRDAGVDAEVEEELPLLEADGGEESGYSRQARALSSLDDDLIPVIPESAMLELVDDTDIGKLMSFMELGGESDATLEVLEVGDDDDELLPVQKGGAASALDEGPDLDYEPEFFLGQPPRPAGSEQDEGDSDISFSMSLSAIDLTSLEEFGTALDELGSIMIAEAGKALPSSEAVDSAAVPPVPLLMPAVLAASYPDTDSGRSVVAELAPPVQLSPLSASWLGAASYHGSDLRSMPVSGILEAVDDEDEGSQSGFSPVNPATSDPHPGAEPEEWDLLTIDSLAKEAVGSAEAVAGAAIFAEVELPESPMGEGPITLREGIYTLLPQPGSKRDLDPALRLLVESVLMPESEAGSKAGRRKRRSKR